MKRWTLLPPSLKSGLTMTNRMWRKGHCASSAAWASGLYGSALALGVLPRGCLSVPLDNERAWRRTEALQPTPAAVVSVRPGWTLQSSKPSLGMKRNE